MASLQTLVNADKGTQLLDSGWYVLVACVGGILLSGTRVAPVVAGFLGVSLIVQINGMLSQGGTKTSA